MIIRLEPIHIKDFYNYNIEKDGRCSMYVLRQSLHGMIGLAMLILSACASPAIVENMIVTPQDMKDISTSADFKKKIAIVQIDDDKKTNTFLTLKVDKASFQKALSASLKQNELLAVPKYLSKFDLFANLVSLNQPLFGGGYKVTSNVEYRVVERETKITWYEELISASYTTTYSNTGLQVGGLRFANEGAIRENIKEFIIRLSETPPPVVDGAGKNLSAPDPLSAIQKLHDLQKLLDDGLIKQEKYILKRDQILNNL